MLSNTLIEAMVFWLSSTLIIIALFSHKLQMDHVDCTRNV